MLLKLLIDPVFLLKMLHPVREISFDPAQKGRQ